MRTTPLPVPEEGLPTMLFALSVAPSDSDDTGSVSAAVADAIEVVQSSAGLARARGRPAPGCTGQLSAKVDRVRERLAEGGGGV